MKGREVMRLALTLMLLAGLSGAAGASGGIGISPPEREVRISGAGTADAVFLLSNPSDRTQEFAVHLPQGTTAEPEEGLLESGERIELRFTIQGGGNATYEPRIVMHPAGIENPMLTSSITARIEVRSDGEEQVKDNLLTGMATGMQTVGEKARVAAIAAGIPAALASLAILRKRTKKEKED